MTRLVFRVGVGAAFLAAAAFLVFRACGDRADVVEPTGEPTRVVPRPPIVEDDQVVVGDSTGRLDRIRISDADQVDAVVSIEPPQSGGERRGGNRDSTDQDVGASPGGERRLLAIETLDPGWFPEFGFRPRLRVRTIGSPDGVTVTYQREPLFGLEREVLVGVDLDERGRLGSFAAVSLVKLWTVHLDVGGRLALDQDLVDAEPSFAGSVGASIEVRDRLRVRLAFHSDRSLSSGVAYRF